MCLFDKIDALTAARIDLVDRMLDVIRTNGLEIYGMKRRIISYKPLGRTTTRLADFEILLEGRRKPRKVFVHVRMNERPMTDHLKHLLEEEEVFPFTLDAKAKVKTILRDLARLLNRAGNPERYAKLHWERLPRRSHPRSSAREIAAAAK